jgi:hypothetical protein
VPPAIIAQMDNAFQEEPRVSALIHTSAFTSMNESPTIKLGVRSRAQCQGNPESQALTKEPAGIKGKSI